MADLYVREIYLEEAHLLEPEVLRVIDIHATCTERGVVLRDFWELQQQSKLKGDSGYAAISHTYGMEVYKVFDCQYTTKLMLNSRDHQLQDHVEVADQRRTTPPRRCSPEPCLHQLQPCGPLTDQRNRVVNDILNMCDVLRREGVSYAWHDGVCIAQHDEEEVSATIRSMGWIYYEAAETIVFLHYVGRPMAPIAPRGCSVYELTCRWHTRVWTTQEAALSKSRRYCVRVRTGSPSLNFISAPESSTQCRDASEFEHLVQVFENKIGLWYRADSSSVAVIPEDTLYDLLEIHLLPALEALQSEAARLHIRSESATCVEQWLHCTKTLSEFLSYIKFGRYDMYFRLGLWECSLRHSKHVGDRINSILGLAGVTDLVVPKDDLQNMEAWTIEFFRRVEAEPGLAVGAVFCVNQVMLLEHDWQYTRHSWVPALWRPLEVDDDPCLEKEKGMEFEVQEDGSMGIRGKLRCVPVQFTYLKIQHEQQAPVTSEPDVQILDLLPHVRYIEDQEQEYRLPMNLEFSTLSRKFYIRKATLSLAPSAPAHVHGCCMGMAVLPIWEPAAHEEHPAAGLHQRCINVGGHFVGGQTFNACLVFPLQSNNPSEKDRPTLIVHRPAGSAATHAFKLGTFRMSQAFIGLAMASDVHSTNIDRLVLL